MSKHPPTLTRADREAFSQRLRALRLERGWTQGKLGARASMRTTQVHAYEVGRYYPRGAVLDRLASALDMTRAELVGDEVTI